MLFPAVSNGEALRALLFSGFTARLHASIGNFRSLHASQNHAHVNAKPPMRAIRCADAACDKRSTAHVQSSTCWISRNFRSAGTVGKPSISVDRLACLSCPSILRRSERRVGSPPRPRRSKSLSIGTKECGFRFVRIVLQTPCRPPARSHRNGCRCIVRPDHRRRPATPAPRHPP